MHLFKLSHRICGSTTYCINIYVYFNQMAVLHSFPCTHFINAARSNHLDCSFYIDDCKYSYFAKFGIFNEKVARLVLLSVQVMCTQLPTIRFFFFYHFKVYVCVRVWCGSCVCQFANIFFWFLSSVSFVCLFAVVKQHIKDIIHRIFNINNIRQPKPGIPCCRLRCFVRLKSIHLVSFALSRSFLYTFTMNRTLHWHLPIASINHFAHVKTH